MSEPPTELRSGESYDTETFTGPVGGRAGTSAFLDCTFDAADLTGLNADKSRFSHCTLTDVRADHLRLIGGSVLDTELTGCRLGALLAAEAELRRVRWSGGKLDLVNLRAASLKEVTFTDVQVGELELLGATAAKVRFVDCRIERLNLTDADLTAFDLTGAEIGVLEGLGSLAGSILTAAQVTALAPALATHLGVRIAD